MQIRNDNNVNFCKIGKIGKGHGRGKKRSFLKPLTRQEIINEKNFLKECFGTYQYYKNNKEAQVKALSDLENRFLEKSTFPLQKRSIDLDV